MPPKVKHLHEHVRMSAKPVAVAVPVVEFYLTENVHGQPQSQPTEANTATVTKEPFVFVKGKGYGGSN